MTADDLLPSLDGVRPAGPNRWIARCPAHEDKNPSLSISETDDRILLRCHAGCTAADIVGSLGLRLSDLFAHPLAPGERKSRARGHRKAKLYEAMRRELVALYILTGAGAEEKKAELLAEDFDRDATAARRLVELLRRLYPEATGGRP